MHATLFHFVVRHRVSVALNDVVCNSKVRCSFRGFYSRYIVEHMQLEHRGGAVCNKVCVSEREQIFSHL